MEEKELFLKLINVKGLGPKTALGVFATGSVSGVIDAINRENILYLTKFPKIGEKLARQIVLDLKGKIDINPYRKGQNKTPCSYCSYKTVCQFDSSIDGNKYRFIKKTSKDEIVSQLLIEESSKVEKGEE